MKFINLLWKTYYLAKDHKKIYQSGMDDALNGKPRKLFKMTIIFENYKKTQELYNQGYDDGLNKKLISKI